MSASRPVVFKHTAQLLPNLDVTFLTHALSCYKTIVTTHLGLSRFVVLVSLLAELQLSELRRNQV